MRMKQQKRKPDPNHAAAAWPDVLARAMQVFAFYHWHTLQRANPGFATDSACITIWNAALESSLMSVRDLDDFFRSNPKARPDDLIASDYQFPAGKSCLTQPEREAINKKLAHLTYHASRQLAQDPLRKNPRTWNNAEMVNRAMVLFLEFLDHLEVLFFAGDSAQIGMIRSARKLIKASLKNINRIAKSELDFTS